MRSIQFTTNVIGGYTAGQIAEFPDDQASSYLLAGVAVLKEEPQRIETAEQPTPELRRAAINLGKAGA